jgi:hypothetical protein
MITDWILRCGDGKNLKNSSKYKIWGISSKNTFGVNFINHVKEGDRLWFVTKDSNGKLAAVATYCSHNCPISYTNEELGWTGSGRDWNADTEVHYKDIYWLNNCEILTHISGSAPIRRYNEKCKVNLADEYNYIIKYSKVKFEL